MLHHSNQPSSQAPVALLPKAILAFYLLILLWLVLFKFSFDISSIVLDYQTRSLNLIPFAGSSQGDMIPNIVVFVPFGLLLSTTLKRVTIRQKLAYIFMFSVSVEVIQFILAIGVTDITDMIMNTTGGLLGLALYKLTNRYVDSHKLDQLIVVASMILLIIFILLRSFVFKVRY